MKAGEIETEDPFLKEMQKRLRNKMKKMEKIAQCEKKIKNKEIVPDEDQRGMLEGKDQLVQQITEAEGIIKLYKEEQPKKGAPRKSSTIEKKSEPEAPKINEEEVIRKTLSKIADAALLHSL
jgi:hypothetical protein